MFKESSYKHLLFWLKVKRIFFIIFFTLVGSILGGVLSSYLVDVLMFYDISKNNIVLIFALVFFTFAIFFTTSISQAIQEGYWKIATLRKLTLMSKKRDSLQKIEQMLTPEIANDIKEAVKDINNINIIENKDNYSIFDEDVQKEIIENNSDDSSDRSKKSTFIYAIQENNNSVEDKSESTTSNEVTTEQIDKLEGTNLDHISKTMAMLSHEYDESTTANDSTRTISTNEDVAIKPSLESHTTEEILEGNTTVANIEDIIIEDEYDDGIILEQPKIEDIEEIVKTIKIENMAKHTYKRKNIPGSSNAIAMATAFEKNKDEIKFKNNIIEENSPDSDEQKEIINESNENSK